ncbi:MULTISPECIES: hypothetical protein [Capnocytophaga]|uniref:Uncharacterized protein n=2 Tax=Capnocytophaga TaxID=1016 RepID=A0A3A1YCF5_9FLAO|nr:MULTISPECIES: hypothetical protein [Capnocytophaga]ATA91587.1 hypothetical protein CGC56_05030 [Capnocytophaga canimorsus]RIY35943.1 hypothetical protein CKY20_08775 [Capnocytophaga canis]GIM58150.1 hypothetical protein CAPN007_03570 [Capnocytophaga canimorsus]
MEENKELIFRVMVTFPDLLEREIKSYNDFFKTDFEIINVIEDEVPFCDIRVTKWKVQNIFGLGYSLAILEDKLREKGEIDW